MVAASPRWEGLPLNEGRKRIIDDLRENDLLRKEEKISHDVNTHERCGTEIEYLSKRQWFIKVMELKEALIKRADEINWYPYFMKARFASWVRNLAWDWCISRQRFYGVPFPLWYCRACGETIFAREEDLPVDPLTDAPPSGCPACQASAFEREKDIMDTWATSSLTPNINLRWREKDERQGVYPMDLRPQAHEIIRTWTFYTMVKSHLHDHTIPWKNVAISGFISMPREESQKASRPGQKKFKAEKLCKSKHGHLTSPFRMLEEYSADCLRHWASNAPLGSDMPLKLEDFKKGKRTLTKLWNAFRFVGTHLVQHRPGQKADLQLLDRWLLRRANGAIARTTRAFEAYDFRTARLETDDFFWHDFCDNYLELAKDRLYDPERRGQDACAAARETLSRAGLTILKLYAPFLPHLTEEIYQTLFRQQGYPVSIHVSAWPEPAELPGIEAFELRAGQTLVALLSLIRKHKSQKGLSMAAELDTMEVTCQPEVRRGVEAGLDDLQAAGRVKTITFREGASERTVKLLIDGASEETTL